MLEFKSVTLTPQSIVILTFRSLAITATSHKQYLSYILSFTRWRMHAKKQRLKGWILIFYFYVPTQMLLHGCKTLQINITYMSIYFVMLFTPTSILVSSGALQERSILTINVLNGWLEKLTRLHHQMRNRFGAIQLILGTVSSGTGRLNTVLVRSEKKSY